MVLTENKQSDYRVVADDPEEYPQIKGDNGIEGNDYLLYTDPEFDQSFIKLNEFYRESAKSVKKYLESHFSENSFHSTCHVVWMYRFGRTLIKKATEEVVENKLISLQTQNKVQRRLWLLFRVAALFHDYVKETDASVAKDNEVRSANEFLRIFAGEGFEDQKKELLSDPLVFRIYNAICSTQVDGDLLKQKRIVQGVASLQLILQVDSSTATPQFPEIPFFESLVCVADFSHFFGTYSLFMEATCRIAIEENWLDVNDLKPNNFPQWLQKILTNQLEFVQNYVYTSGLPKGVKKWLKDLNKQVVSTLRSDVEKLDSGFETDKKVVDKWGKTLFELFRNNESWHMSKSFHINNF